MATLTGTTLDTLDHPSIENVLILGGGFAGVRAALTLADSSKYNVTLLSEQPSFRYYPMLYKTATGGSQKASNILLSEILDDKAINIVNDTARSLDRSSKKIRCASGKSISFDILVVALGSVTNYFGIKGLEENSYGIKTLPQAKLLRDQLHEQLLDEGKPDINYIVIGGGPTGVELAGALPAHIKHIMKRHGLNQKRVNVDLVEALPRLMPRMSQRYSNKVAGRLKKLGVKLYLNQKVLAETHDQLKMSNKTLQSHTVVWTAGVANNPFIVKNGFNLDEHGKVEVDEFLEAEENIFVLGDNAGTPYSGMAQTALYDGRFVADNLLRRAGGESAKRYKPKKPIYITPAGKHWAAVSWGNHDFFGFSGWLLRTIADLIGYHDLEPWWKASAHWVADAESDTSCQICARK